MERKRKRSHLVWILPLAAVLVGAVVFLCLHFFLGGESSAPSDPIPDQGRGLFSWHDEVFEKEEREILIRLMREQGLTELYQDVPHDLSVTDIRALTEDCRENGIRVYLLVGDPEWALDRKATELRREIQRAALMGFSGVMVDIEPGSTDKWKKDRESVMEIMLQAFLRGKADAQQNGLEMIVCLSWYYDDFGFESQLEQLVAEGCDTLAIMNYNREDEAGQIETEAALCRKYGKKLINIYELQEVGKYDLEEIHTYREVGLDALWKSEKTLRRVFSDQKFSVALHDYRALKEMTGTAVTSEPSEE